MSLATINERQDALDAFMAHYFPAPGQQPSQKRPSAPAHDSDRELLERMLRAKNGDKIRALLTGDLAGYASQSEADAALAHELTWWANHDLDQAERIMRTCGSYREKWDSRRGETTWLRQQLERASTNIGADGYAGCGPETLIIVKGDARGNGHAAMPWQSNEWPKPPGEDAFFGLAGRIVERVGPHTEADRTALLVNILTMYGDAVGSRPHVLIGNTRHTAKLFVGVVGPTATGRKGEATGTVRRIFEQAQPHFPLAFVGGMSSGEGLIWAVRDEIQKREPIREKGRVVEYQMVVSEEGISDKRLMVIEPEISRVLNAMARQGSTLSSQMREAWDTNQLRIMTKNSPVTATDSHIGIIAHVTPEELRTELSELSIANGLANRFAWIASRRSKVLPDPAPMEGPAYEYCVSAIKGALVDARSRERVGRDEGANEIWRDTYEELSTERGFGLKAALCARGPQIVLRMALIHALMNGSRSITADHLVAAMALWDYAERSVAFLFGDATGNPTADAIARALEHRELTRTEISELFKRNKKAADIDVALQLLLSLGRARRTTRDDTGGRHTEVWSRPA